MKTINYLRYHRKRWALSQEQTARLVGLSSRTSISDYEKALALPALRTAMGFEFIFGETVAIVEDEVMRRAAELDEAYRDRTDAAADKIRELLSVMTSRAGNAFEL